MLTFREALKAAKPRDEAASSTEKKNYAERLSRHLATLFANRLRASFPGILPDADGQGQESRARTAKGVKKLDVNYSTPELGLGLGVSIKTLNFRDGRSARYTKNYTRIDNELRAEAKDYHQRQPYAVMVAVVFLPVDACDDGRGTGASSFGAAVRAFRHRAQRSGPKDEDELFERLYVALYDPTGEEEPPLMVFDVADPPPKQGRPAIGTWFDLEELVVRIRATYDDRNDPPFLWAAESEGE